MDYRKQLYFFTLKLGFYPYLSDIDYTFLRQDIYTFFEDYKIPHKEYYYVIVIDLVLKYNDTKLDNVCKIIFRKHKLKNILE